MNNNIYEINNLKCKYPSNAYPVLEIDNLYIKKGSNTFFVGASGVGKSTILETLGLMNNTIFNAELFNSQLSFLPNGSIINMIQLWKLKENKIAAFRKQHLSFIFQNTNLFNTLSAYENIAITAILQGLNKHEAIKKTKNIVDKILNDVPYDKPIHELSGGQRQRIAFARAIVSDFSVLFADEPTGNLDAGNAHKLMSILNNEAKQKTKIIVTHDISLATKFADKIILIDRKKRANVDSYFGTINSETIFDKHDNLWHNSKNSFSNRKISELLQDKLYNNLD